MFALVEPCITDHLVDRPNLGCAMLIAACREESIPVSFVAGETSILSFLASLDPDTPIADGTPLGVFRELYDAVVGERGPRPHVNGVPVVRLEGVYRLIMRHLLAQLDAGGRCDVPIVEEYVGRIAATGCEVVGFSLRVVDDSLTREVRRRLRADHGMTVIAGGPMLTRVSPEDYEDTLRREQIDYLVTGPGERVLPRLLDRLAEGRAPDDLPNTYFLRDGRVTGFEEIVRQDLDALPFPDYSDVDFAGHISPEMVLPLESARGCSWDRCAFCDHNAGPVERYAAFSIERVVEIVRHLRTTYGCHEFAFHDLELPPGRAAKLSKAIVAAGLDGLAFSAGARFAAGYRNADLWASMRAAGFTMIEWGLESGCQRTLDAMRKGTRVSTASEVLRMSAEAGIANLCFVLYGFPGETERDANQTVEFLREHRAFISRTGMEVLHVRSGSPLGREPERWGVRVTAEGRYEAEEGMGQERARGLVKSLAALESFDPSRSSSDPVMSVAKTNVSRILYGLLRSHGLMPPDAAVAAVSEGRLSDVFPLVLGEVHDGDGGPEWRPIAVGETPMVNLRMPQAARPLDEDELSAFRRADGARSLAEVCGGIPPGDDPAAARRQAFVLEAITNGLGLAFGRRWEP